MMYIRSSKIVSIAIFIHELDDSPLIFRSLVPRVLQEATWSIVRMVSIRNRHDSTTLPNAVRRRMTAIWVTDRSPKLHQKQ
jgi:hypothetical protein